MEDRLFDPTPTLTVSELLGRAKVVVERALGDDVWVEGEIQGKSRRGEHVYFNLVESDEAGRVRARLPIVLFDTYRRGVNVLLKRAGIDRMSDGLHIRIRGAVTVYDRTGAVQLKMTAIDPTHTVGLLAAERDRVLRALRSEGLIDANGRQILDAVPLRVALVTSRGSAAAEDFLDELRASRLAFAVRLHDVRVQGRDAEASVVAALAAIAPDTDVVALVRGGGDRTDLSAFDSEKIARAIAAAPVPVITGLGHETDRAVADEVAYASLKTPTACAAFLVERVRGWCAALDARWADIDRRARRRLAAADAELTHHRRLVATAGRATVVRADQRSLDLVRALRTRVPRALDGADRHLHHLGAQLGAYDPARTLARGWSITRAEDGTLIRSPDDAPPGTALVTTVARGRVRSRVTEEEPA